MDNKAKLLLVAFLSTLFVASCTNTNGRYALGQQASQGKEGVTHTHNGVAHTHLLPEGGLSHSHNYNTSSPPDVTDVTTTSASTSSTQPPVVTPPVGTCAPCRAGTTRDVVNAPATGNTNSGGNCHMHSGRRHCHPLPATGTSHTHQQGGAASTTRDVVNSGEQPASTYYDYSGGSATGGSYYNYGGSGGSSGGSAGGNGVSHSHGAARHSHALPASGLNHTHNRGSGTGDTYSAYASGGGASTVAESGGDTYLVKSKDTVFQVMRNTGVYWKTIIKLNNLQAPDYVITPGQTLRLK